MKFKTNNMTVRYLIIAWLFFQGTAFAQIQKDFAERITPADLKENLSILASDALEGRATGTRGQKMAAAFISHHFRELGLTAPVNGGYLQHFDLYKIIPGEVTLSTRGTTYENFKDIIYYGKDNSPGAITLSVVFAGQGREEDYSNLQTQGKGVLVMAAIFLARETLSLMTGESASKEVLSRTRSIVANDPRVNEVDEILSMHLGPNDILLAISIDFRDELNGAEIEEAARDITTALEHAIPATTRVFLRPTRRRDAPRR